MFISDADISEFIRAEIDGNTLAKEDFTVESGSTIMTINSSCLNDLSEGEHTVSIVSTSGTASTRFIVQKEPVTANTEKPTADVTDIPNTGSSSTLIVIVVVLVVLLIGGGIAFYVNRKRRSM